MVKVSLGLEFVVRLGPSYIYRLFINDLSMCQHADRNLGTLLSHLVELPHAFLFFIPADFLIM